MSKFICYSNNNFCSISKEFLIFDKENHQIIGSHSPVHATLFSSKKEAETAVKTYVARSTGIVITDDIDALNAEFTAWLENLAIYRLMPMKDLNFSKPYNGEDADAVLDWTIYHSKNENSISHEDYKTWPKLYSFFECVFDISNLVDRDNNEILVSFKMLVNKKTSFETFEKEFNKIKNRVEFSKDGFKFIKIFEHTLSEYDCYYFQFNDSTYKIGGRSKQFETNSLEELFNFWQKNYYYE